MVGRLYSAAMSDSSSVSGSVPNHEVEVMVPACRFAPYSTRHIMVAVLVLLTANFVLMGPTGWVMFAIAAAVFAGMVWRLRRTQTTLEPGALVLRRPTGDDIRLDAESVKSAMFFKQVKLGLVGSSMLLYRGHDGVAQQVPTQQFSPDQIRELAQHVEAFAPTRYEENHATMSTVRQMMNADKPSE